jgi:hypothetical protein
MKYVGIVHLLCCNFKVATLPFDSKKEAQDAEAERRIKEQRDFELQKNTPGEVPGSLAGLLEEFFKEHGAKSLAPKTLQTLP